MQSNVVPELLTAVFDIRIATTVDVVKFEALVNEWCKESGQGIYIEWEQKDPQVEVTKLDCSNPFWTAFKSATDDMYDAIRPGTTRIKTFRFQEAEAEAADLPGRNR